MTAPRARRGKVWFADVASEGRRPVLVLTRDRLGHILRSVICAPITSTVRGLTTEVALGQEAGLREPSVANFDNVLLLDRSRLLRRLGRASPMSMADSCRALAVATGCP